MTGRFDPPSHADQFAATARRLQYEREAAVHSVERILRETSRENWKILTDHPDLQTCGALERVAMLFQDALPKDPLYAHALAELAVAVAQKLDRDAYPSVIVDQLRAHAWKDLGKAFRFLGRNEDSIQAFSTAEAQIRQHVVLAHDRAIIRFNLAVTLQELGQFDRSRAALTYAKQVFQEHGDIRNVVRVGFAEGMLLQRLHRFREAREIYLLLLAANPHLDTETMAAVHHAIGFSSVDLQDFGAAESNLRQAISLYRQAGQPIQILKVELGRGRMLICKHQLEDGIAHLRPIRREFLRNRMHEEAGLCGLEIVKAFLLLDRPSEAETFARRIVGEFTIANLNRRAIAALDYLSEAIAARVARPALVSDIREYILSLQTAPEREDTLND